MRFASVALFLIFLVISIPFCYSAQYSLSYDLNGNLVTGDGKYRVYNSLNQLYQIYNGSNSTGVLLESYQYHPTEERVHVKTVYNTTGGIKETVYYISKSFVQVVNSSGEFNYTYVYQNGQLVAQKNPDGSKYFIISDAEGSATVVTNSSGSVIENNSYSPFGDVLTGGTKSRYGYEDKEYDSVIKSVDFNFRRYNPKTILFEQPDTIIQNVYDPQSLNRYMFERGNPYRYVDKTGHANWFVDTANKIKQFLDKAVEAIDNAFSDVAESIRNEIDSYGTAGDVAEGLYDATVEPYVDLACYAGETAYTHYTKDLGSEKRQKAIQNHMESRNNDALYNGVSIAVDLLSFKSSSVVKLIIGDSKPIISTIDKVFSISKKTDIVYSFSTHGNVYQDASKGNIRTPWYFANGDIDINNQYLICSDYSQIENADMTKR